MNILFPDDCNIHTDIVALPFWAQGKIVRKPLGKSYVDKPTTLGQQLRNRRLELRLMQKEVAKMMGVSDETINNWEHDHTEPPVSASAKIIRFLGYNPFQFDTSSLAGKLKAYRYANGLSQEQAGKALGLDETTIHKLEGGKVRLSHKTLEKLRSVMDIVTG